MRPLTIILALSFVTSAVRGDDKTGTEQTIEYVRKLQTSTGGFLAAAPAPQGKAEPTLRSTSAAVRALGYLKGKVPNPQECARFVDSCFDSASGGFSDTPRGKPDLFTTAVGIMAVTELKMPTDKYADGIVKYLSEHAKTIEEIRIAAAGLERIATKSPRTEAWLATIKQAQNADGTFGKGLGQARDTGGTAVIILRLGGTLSNRDAVIAAIKEGQRPSGGFGKDDSELDADLETSYRILRCFVMLKERPTRVEGLRTYVAKCRNEDGGYGISPGQPSSVGATYFATIIKHWLE